jgi:hypothetical protein
VYISLVRRRYPDGCIAVNDKMFGQLHREETCAARRALAASESAEHKEFNLDIAKLLFVPAP